MPTPSDSVTLPPFVPSSQNGYGTHTTCPSDAMDRGSEYTRYVEPDPMHAAPGSESLPMEDPQPAQPESSTHLDSTNNNPTQSKMPGALVDDSEDYLSSSSGEVSEASSSDSVDTVRPQIAEPSQGLVSLQQESTPLPAASGFRLTTDHPTLTTFFEGEIIGPKYTFQTRHPSWGATDRTDMQHWARFPAWRPLAKQAKKPDFHYKNFAQRENIFMRWKESFLVPDHRVREISGASFEGFYYICFNQVSGDINGIYFHAKSEKYQQLELKHVPDRGCLPAMEFR
ncbi:MAG: hypothetical protein Q9225_001042 [Loekoesia sp. 1 TL-2023]